MKHTLILLLFSCALWGQEKEVTITGAVTAVNKDNLLGLIIELRMDTFIVAAKNIQEDGTFKISTTINKDVDVYYKGIGVVTTYVQTIKPTGKDTIILIFHLPRSYKKKFGKIVCPKCNKNDKTIPISYGLKQITIVETNRNGVKTYLPYDKHKYYNGGCVHSEFDAQYFCERDKIKF